MKITIEGVTYDAWADRFGRIWIAKPKSKDEYQLKAYVITREEGDGVFVMPVKSIFKPDGYLPYGTRTLDLKNEKHLMYLGGLPNLVGGNVDKKSVTKDKEDVVDVAKTLTAALTSELKEETHDSYELARLPTYLDAYFEKGYCFLFYACDVRRQKKDETDEKEKDGKKEKVSLLSSVSSASLEMTGDLFTFSVDDLLKSLGTLKLQGFSESNVKSALLGLYNSSTTPKLVLEAAKTRAEKKGGKLDEKAYQELIEKNSLELGNSSHTITRLAKYLSATLSQRVEQIEKIEKETKLAKELEDKLKKELEDKLEKELKDKVKKELGPKKELKQDARGASWWQENFAWIACIGILMAFVVGLAFRLFPSWS